MSTTSKVTTIGAPGGASASTWVSPAGRHGLNGPIDPLSPGGFFGIDDSWQRSYDNMPRGQGGFGVGKGKPTVFFTPLVGRLALAFEAIEGLSDGRMNTNMFLSDLKRAVAVYEYNMRLSTDAMAYQGSVVNRYS